MTKPTDTKYDADEFGRLFSDYRVHYIRIADSYVHDRAVAEDIVADCFLYVLENRERIVWSEGGMKYYLYKSVRDRCLTHLRNRKIQMRAEENISKTLYWRVESALNSLQNDELSQKMQSSEVMEIYRRELEKMPELTRLIYLDSRQWEMTYAQIAEKYAVSPRKVTYEIQRALALLRLGLKDYLPLAIIAALLKV